MIEAMGILSDYYLPAMLYALRAIINELFSGHISQRLQHCMVNYRIPNGRRSMYSFLGAVEKVL